MLVFGLALLATSIAVLWLSLPGRQSGVKPFLRGGGDLLAAIIVTGCFGAGLVVTVAGIAQ